MGLKAKADQGWDVQGQMQQALVQCIAMSALPDDYKFFETICEIST